MIQVGNFAIVNEAEPIPSGLVVVRLKTRPVTPDWTLEGYGWEPGTQAALLEIEKAKPGRMLDVGTGTGILAIAAAKLAGSHKATEMYPAKAVHARANIELNSAAVEVEDTEEVPDGEFDLIVANIGWDDWIDGHRRLLKERAPRVLASVRQRTIGKMGLRMLHSFGDWGVAEL